MKSDTIMVTGGTGSWGNELVRQLIGLPEISQVVIYSRGEHKQVEMKRAFTQYLGKMRFIIGDVRDLEKLKIAMKGVDKVYHMAALKHVPVCEENPWEAVQTNIVGTNNVIESAIQNGVKRVVFVSTDKAVEPLNLYGVTKSAAEKLITNANLMTGDTDFLCLRAGNVLGTNGSVVPLFIEQIKKTNSITLTDPNMTRFFLRVEDAIRLVLKAEVEAVGGEITVVRMPACKILDLAKALIGEFGNADTVVRQIGARPGEKIHEVLISKYEAQRVISRGGWHIILPMTKIPKIEARYAGIQRSEIGQEYSSLSADQLTEEGIRRLLGIAGFFNTDYKSSLSDLGPDELLNYFKNEGWLEVH